MTLGMHSLPRRSSYMGSRLTTFLSTAEQLVIRCSLPCSTLSLIYLEFFQVTLVPYKRLHPGSLYHTRDSILGAGNTILTALIAAGQVDHKSPLIVESLQSARPARWAGLSESSARLPSLPQKDCQAQPVCIKSTSEPALQSS